MFDKAMWNVSYSRGIYRSWDEPKHNREVGAKYQVQPTWVWVLYTYPAPGMKPLSSIWSYTETDGHAKAYCMRVQLA